MTNIVGRTICEVTPGIGQGEFDWIGFYGRIALHGGSETFEQYSAQLERWYQVQVHSPQTGFFVTIFVDITQAKQNAVELEDFFTINLDLLCIADMEGNFLKVNKAWEAILGYATAEIQGRKYLEFVHPDDIQATLDVMARLAGSEDVLDFTNRSIPGYLWAQSGNPQKLVCGRVWKSQGIPRLILCWNHRVWMR